MSYSADVQWSSPAGNLIQFEDSGERTVNSTSVTLSPLIPGNSYQIRVSAITLEGRGEEVLTTGDVPTTQGRYQFV